MIYKYVLVFSEFSWMPGCCKNNLECISMLSFPQGWHVIEIFLNYFSRSNWFKWLSKYLVQLCFELQHNCYKVTYKFRLFVLNPGLNGKCD